jgi:hypothetical protein
MPHRILEILPTLDRSGAEKQLLLLAAGLPRDEFEVHVCALTRGGPLWPEFQAAGVPVTVLGKAWKFDPVALWRLRQFVRRLRPDLVHTWIFAANAYGRVAGILAAKKTAELIPLCHPLPLSFVDVRFSVDREKLRVEVEAEARTTAPTGVEMEALLAVQVACATIYDMCKAVQKDMVIGDCRLVYKAGGKSGVFRAE